ncbi:MAG: DUF4214 domain-containing protein [Burkholderiaceae bacterium]
MAITTQMRTDVSQLYVALFGRAPDGEGLGYWVGQLDAGKSIVDIANAMYGTEPARDYYPLYQTNQEIVGSFYTNVLGRDADAEGLAYWTDKLNAAGATPGSVIAEIIGVVANYTGTDPAGLKSAALFQNKVQVAQWYGEQNGSIADASIVLSGVTEDPASVAAAEAQYSGAVSDVPLTRFTDVQTGTKFLGYLDYNQYTGADEQTLTNSDRLTGNSDNDQLIAYLTVGSRPSLTGIETVQITAKAAAPTLDLTDATGVKTVVNSASDEAAVLTFSNINSLVDVKIQGTKSDTVVTFVPTAVAGTADNLNVILDGAGIATDRVNFTARRNDGTAAIEKLTVTASGAASFMNNVTTGNSLTSVDISGAANLSIGTKAAGGFNSASLATVNAGTATGNLSLNIAAAGAISQTVTTGTGNDVVIVSGVTANDTFDLGAGADRIVLTDAGSNQAAKFLGVEQVEARVAGTSINLTNGANVNLLAVAETAGVASIANVTAVKSGTTIAFEGEGAANAIGAANTATFGNVTYNLANATGSTDVINVTYNNAGSMLGSNGVVNIGTLTNTGNNVETMNLTFSDLGSDDTVNVAGITVGNALKTLTVTSDSKVTLNGVAALTALTNVDASGVKDAFTATFGALGAGLADAANAVVKTGGAGNNNVTLFKGNLDGATNTALTVDGSAGTGSQTFTITNTDVDVSGTTPSLVFQGGQGADALVLTSVAGSINSISGGAGIDNLNLTASAGLDRLIFALGDTGSTIATGDTVTAFVSGAAADQIDLRSFGFDAALQGVNLAVAALNGTANEFGAGVAQKAVAVFNNGVNSTMYIDTNGDAKLGAGDMVVNFIGTNFVGNDASVLFV